MSKFLFIVEAFVSFLLIGSMFEHIMPAQLVLAYAVMVVTAIYVTVKFYLIRRK